MSNAFYELQHKELWETRAENVRLKRENYELKEIKFNREAALELQGIENERLRAQLEVGHKWLQDENVELNKVKAQLATSNNIYADKCKELAAAKENNWDVLQDARMWNQFKKMMKEWEVI